MTVTWPSTQQLQRQRIATGLGRLVTHLGPHLRALLLLLTGRTQATLPS